MQEQIPADASYSITGTYFSDGHHGSELEVPGCDVVLLDPELLKAPQRRKLRPFIRPSGENCHAVLGNDRMTGVFTGRFVRKQMRPFGTQSPGDERSNVFIISVVETKDLDISSIWPADASCVTVECPERTLRESVQGA